MKHPIRSFCHAMAVAALGFAFPASAVPIPIAATPGGDLIFNFNFSGKSPAPPYFAIQVSFIVSGFDAGERIDFDYFAGLNGAGGRVGTGTLFGPGNFLFPPLVAVDFFAPSIRDGVFSFGLRTGDDISLVEAASGTEQVFATAYTDLNHVILGAPDVIVTGVVVPEPASLALIGLGLAGLGFSRRKKA